MKRIENLQEIVAKEIERIGDIGESTERLEKFVAKAIEIQNNAWDPAYAERKLEYSIAVLDNVIAPNEELKDRLADYIIEVSQAYERANAEIAEGIRVKPQKLNRKTKKFLSMHDVKLVQVDENDKGVSLTLKVMFK